MPPDRNRPEDEELEDARWLTRAQIAAGEVALPTTHSISFRLIEDWYDSRRRTRHCGQEPGVTNVAAADDGS